MKCNFCGYEINAGGKFCAKCGKPVMANSAPQQNRPVPPNGQIPQQQNRMVPPNGQIPPQQSRMVPPNGQIPPQQNRMVQSNGQIPPQQNRMAPPNGQIPPQQNRMVSPNGQIPQQQNYQIPPQQMNSKKKGMPAGAIVAVILAILILLLSIGAGILYWLWDGQGGFKGYISTITGGSSSSESSEDDDDWGWDDDDDDKKNSKKDKDDKDTEDKESEVDDEDGDVSEAEAETKPAEKTTAAAEKTKAPETEAPTEAKTEKTTELVFVESKDPVVFKTASATSVRADIITNTMHYSYPAAYVLDNNLNSCWCEGATKEGIGENITLFAEKPGYLSEIEIYNGLCSDKDTYYKNNRIKDCRIEFSDGNYVEVTLDGEYVNQPCVVKLGTPVKTSSMKITILSTYPAPDKEDTCISEIKVK